ncbi:MULTISPECIES: ATP-binding protein [Brucella/Ochrobactrum group]|uniref:AlbA family DNA-binding domain-containing protein n=1 Tax=Brucella/Ochrobactrum group TaxID=2826938 RepID=UPI000DEFF773|nr:MULTISPECIES: ATP-binding protein [Brucella/Ochrobactrum group]
MIGETLEDLIDYDPDTLRVFSRESRRLEFKRSFDRHQIAAYERTLAAFANTVGGVIVFGVADRPRVIVGTDPAALADEADITTMLRQDFSPEIPFEARTYQCGALTLFALAVEPNINRPVICQKSRTKRTLDANGQNPRDEQAIQEGAIYYRYVAQTASIKYNELQSLLDEREERRLRIIMETLKAVERVGYEKVGIVDATSFGDAGKATNLYVSKETARSMNFIDEGRFAEVDDGASPAYLVVGKVSLGEVVHAPLEAADRNLPNEVATVLQPIARELYGEDVRLSKSAVKPLLETFNLLEMPFHEYDPKVNRRYITREGIAEIERCMRNEPLKAIKSFGAKSNIRAYEDGLAENAEVNDIPADDIVEAND